MHTRSTIVLWAIVLVILLQALSVQMLSAMNGDVAFLFSMAKHTGLQEFYLQYYEVNPPLIVYLYKLFLLPSLLGINELASANTSMILYILLCLVLSYHYLSHLSHFARFSLTLAFTIGLVAVSEIMFLQREHIIAAGLIVYVAHALNSENNAKTRVWWELSAPLS
ncbi:hypothetical protein JCM19240_1154 [Vibrio maritimus]|uniref:Glycosyltransferase RgtA/B/C/D-like domain-containing protein n=1 Tax=Vibrio maritimus TaxID=990268 RepID=A0A090T2Q0_9VIBR|nr:hypothetical protein JCM19240_1154 [Vibrio maritimus]